MRAERPCLRVCIGTRGEFLDRICLAAHRTLKSHGKTRNNHIGPSRPSSLVRVIPLACKAEWEEVSVAKKQRLRIPSMTTEQLNESTGETRRIFSYDRESTLRQSDVTVEQAMRDLRNHPAQVREQGSRRHSSDPRGSASRQR
jgi:hypothetical protein